MWEMFFQFHNGKTFFIKDYLTSDDLHLGSDASGFACAAVFGRDWFRLRFPIDWIKKHSIALLYVAIMVVCRQWLWEQAQP